MSDHEDNDLEMDIEEEGDPEDIIVDGILEACEESERVTFRALLPKLSSQTNRVGEIFMKLFQEDLGEHLSLLLSHLGTMDYVVVVENHSNRQHIGLKEWAFHWTVHYKALSCFECLIVEKDIMNMCFGPTNVFRRLCEEGGESEVHEKMFRRILKLHPELARTTPCECGCLPLHYLFRSPAVPTNLILPLLEAYPDALLQENDCGISPYDIACVNTQVPSDVLEELKDLRMHQLINKQSPDFWSSVTPKTASTIASGFAETPSAQFEFVKQLVERSLISR